jgi:hypothetical protein
MKSNTLTTALNIVLALSLLLSVIFCLQFIFLSREFRSISGQVANINAYRNNLQMLARDCQEYSRKNRAILPVLESVGIKEVTNSPAK